MEIDENIMNELMMFLQGKHTPKKFHLKNLPNLNEDQSFTIIYMIQEWLGLISDKFEMCCVCKSIYDSECDGIYSGDNEDEMEELNEAGYDFSKDDLQKHFCGGCV